MRRGEGRGDGCGGEGRYLCIFVFLHFCIFVFVCIFVLSCVKVRAGAWVDSVRLHRGGKWGAVRGGTGGAVTTLLLQPGDTVVAVDGRTDGRLVTQLQFTTKAGETLGPVGAGAGQVSE